MKALSYYIALPFIYGISLLPFQFLYFLSDLLYLILYKGLKYRVEVVNSNLRNSFPDKSDKEIIQIQNRFYRYFFDIVLETIKTLTVTPKSVMKRVQFEDTSLFKKFYDKHQSVIIVMGHYGNWELAGARFSQEEIHQLYVIYHPLKSKYFDQMMYHMRTRLGNKLYSRNDAFRGMVRNREEITATAFIADQTPSPNGAYWTNFLNQDTPVFVGTAKIAKKLDYPIIYVSVNRPKRGRYVMTSEILAEHPAVLTEDEISELHTKRLEKDIQEHPDIWLWSHRRWKHRRPIK